MDLTDDKKAAWPKESFEDFLTPEQRQTIDRERYFDVTGSDGFPYRIWTTSISHNVHRLSNRVDGRALQSFCAHIRLVQDPYSGGITPRLKEDTWLAQKLLIEQDIETFLKVAY